jgi:hypothetical protein
MANKVKKTKTKKKRAKRYDEAERVQFLNKYQELRNEGKNAAVAAKEIGVPYITLRTWQKNIEVKAKGRKKKAAAPARGAKATKKSKTKRAPSGAAVVLVLNDGTRVECSSPQDAVKFIKANR